MGLRFSNAHEYTKYLFPKAAISLPAENTENGKMKRGRKVKNRQQTRVQHHQIYASKLFPMCTCVWVCVPVKHMYTNKWFAVSSDGWKKTLFLCSVTERERLDEREK